MISLRRQPTEALEAEAGDESRRRPATTPAWRPATTPAKQLRSSWNLAPPPEFAATLANICTTVHESEPSAASKKRDARSRIEARRSTGVGTLGLTQGPPKTAGGVALGPLQRVPAAFYQRKGQLRPTDLRGYGTLEQLLNPDSALLTPPPDDAESIDDDFGELAQTANDFPRRPQCDSRNGRPGSSRAGSKTTPLRKPIGRRPHSKVSSSDDDSSDESIPSSSSGRSLLKEIADSAVSTDWLDLLAFARDRRKSVIVRAPAFQEPFCSSPISLGQPTSTGRNVTISTKASSSQSGSKAARPRSPLRPGVYVGREVQEHVKLTNIKRKAPKGLPRAAKTGWKPKPASSKHQEAAAPVQSEKDMEENEEEKIKKGMSTWQTMLAQLEDSRQSDESKAYNAWRKRVIECARNMQLEVSRFKLDD